MGKLLPLTAVCSILLLAAGIVVGEQLEKRNAAAHRRIELVLRELAGPPPGSPQTLAPAIRNVGFGVISSAEIRNTFRTAVMCASRPDGTVTRTSDFIIRGPSPTDLRRGDVSILPGLSRTFSDMDQEGRYIFWWESDGRASSTVVFEHGKAGTKLLP